ncbi:MAG: Hsp33 family molecular chaperone HslO [Syntrophales bacterium]|nr:Hsp33 family molecular chaperone HslO [Syntrophales bacterium]
MNDYVVRAISEKGNILGLACITTDLVEEACRLHCAAPTASAALGRALTGGALMASLLKLGQRLAIKFEGSGPLKKIIVEADYEGTVRGFVAEPDIELPPRGEKLDVSGALGKEGFLTVIKDLGAKEPYSGIVRLRTGEIAEDLAYYFAESEQIPTAIGLGVYVEPPGRVAATGGFLIQTLPPPDEALVDQLVERISAMESVTQLLRRGQTPEDILGSIFASIPFRIMEKKKLSLKCTCSRERIERVIISLGKEEIAGMIAEQGAADVACEFCRTTYHFDERDLRTLLAEMNQGKG